MLLAIPAFAKTSEVAVTVEVPAICNFQVVDTTGGNFVMPGNDMCWTDANWKSPVHHFTFTWQCNTLTPTSHWYAAMDANWTPTLTFNLGGEPIGHEFVVSGALNTGSDCEVYALWSGNGVPSNTNYNGTMTFTFVCGG